MHLWRIDKLKAQLALAPLTDREMLPYVVANGALLGLPVAFPPDSPNSWDTAGGVAGVVLIVLGILWVFRQNGGAAGTDFLQRYTAIGWVICMRLVPIALLAGLVLYLKKGAPLEGGFETTAYDFVSGLGLSVVYFQRVGSHVRDVSNGLPNKRSQPAAAGAILSRRG